MRKIVSILLLVIYSALFTIPYIPYIVYITGSFNRTNDSCVIGINTAGTVIGDICYLKAIMERVGENTGSEKSEAPPPPATETLGLIYINSELLFAIHQILPDNFNFKGYMISIKETFVEVFVPPPKFIS
ncbi:MAG: hypothetical protein K8S16_11035 [Bacteroidales bacterium]|nr:hypothetical protein [Bacteroidales bacterium]